MSLAKTTIILQFRFELLEIKPTIWRRVQVPSKYSFWDLHVAIQDSMGWLDGHLHAFYVRMPRKRKDIEIGIPDDDALAEDVIPGWEVPLVDYFTEPGKWAPYLYDFGDGWRHLILLEGILLKETGVKYPRCIAGERACPPEDCGGVFGYCDLIEVLKKPKDPEFNGTVAWLKGHVKNYHPYDPNYFSSDEVTFANPKRKLNSWFP